MGCKKVLRRLHKAEVLLTEEHDIVRSLLVAKESSEMSNLEAAFDLLKASNVRIEKFVSQI
jgi:hypothetical protein